jgi:hypothetical protein
MYPPFSVLTWAEYGAGDICSLPLPLGTLLTAESGVFLSTFCGYRRSILSEDGVWGGVGAELFRENWGGGVVISFVRSMCMPSRLTFFEAGGIAADGSRGVEDESAVGLRQASGCLELDC